MSEFFDVVTSSIIIISLSRIVNYSRMMNKCLEHGVSSGLRFAAGVRILSNGDITISLITIDLGESSSAIVLGKGHRLIGQSTLILSFPFSINWHSRIAKHVLESTKWLRVDGARAGQMLHMRTDLSFVTSK